ncbi:coil containing protein [Vibrio phage 141E35-1]|nr:coil containing protein [Vibrio phage 141E35-1]
MITVTYHPIDSDATTSTANSLAEWFIDQFGEEMDVPKGARITCGNPSRETDVTEQIALGDPDGHLTRTDGEYNVLIVPAGPETWVPLIVSLVVSVAAVLLTPKPDVPSAANRRQDSATNSLGNRSNEAKPGERFQDVRGFEPAVYADLLMEPHRRYTDNREIEYVYGTATAGFGLISEPRDGITKWEVVEGAQLDVYGPGTEPGNGSPVQTFGSSTISFPLVASTRSRNVTGQILAPPNQLEIEPLKYRATNSGTISTVDAPEDFDFRNTIDAGDTITLNDWYSWRYNSTPEPGLDVYDRIVLSGTYTVTSVGKQSLQVNPRSGWEYFGSGFEMREYAWRSNDFGYYFLELDRDPGLLPGGWTRESYFATFQGLFDGSVGPFEVPEGSTNGWVNLLAQNGIRKSGSNDEEYSVKCQFTVYELDSNGVRTGQSSVQPEITLTSNPILITDQVGVTQDFTIPYRRAEIVGKRTSTTDKNFSGTVIDEVKWAAMYSVEPTPVVLPSDVTTVYATIKQTPAALGVQERKLNFGVTRYERSYLGNGQMSPTLDTPSDEFADAVVGLALDPTVGKNVTLEQLNVDSLYAVQEEIVEYFGTRDAVKFGYSFSTTDMTFEDHLTLIARAVFCKVFRVGNTYEFRFNRPRSKGETALLLNHRLKYNGTDKRNRRFTDPDRKGYDGVVVSYKDAKTKVFEDIRIPEGTFPVNPYEIELPGVTNKQIATYHALREWNRIKYRRVFHETEAHSLARGLVPDDRITMANDTLTKSQNGNVLAQSGLELRLAEGVNVVAGEQYTITLLYKSGTVENILCEAGTIGPTWVRLFSLPSEDLYTGSLEMRTAYNLYESVEAEKDDMLVEAMTVSIKNGQERVRVQAVNYDVRYWDGDPKEVSTGSFSTAFNDSFDKGA